MNRGTFRYRDRKDPRTALRMRICEIAQARGRYGYRTILVSLNRDGAPGFPRVSLMTVSRQELIPRWFNVYGFFGVKAKGILANPASSLTPKSWHEYRTKVRA